MSIEENKAVARRWNEEIATGKSLEAFDEVLDKNYTNYSGADGSWSSTIQGLEQAKKHYGELSREHPTWRLSVDDMIGEGDKVAVRYTVLDGEKPMGNGIAFYRFSDGKIADHWYCFRELGA
jgi:predicted SnoaL-like aldol condensation-catalyzing enzyme